MISSIRLNLGPRSYNIFVCYNQLHQLGEYINNLDIGQDAIIITNLTVRRLSGKRISDSLRASGITVKYEIVPDTEKSKSERQCVRLINRIAQFDCYKRRIFIVALGGGVIGDLAGFVASIYRRGIPYIQIPTTLLAQVDSAIGGKVAIDLKAGKNLVGAFYQPRLVFNDAYLLSTLTGEDLISGLAEVVKYGIIKSPHLFSFLEKNYKKLLSQDKKCLLHIIRHSCWIKARIVEKDELDTKNIRVILNLGHTVGHAIEAATGYKKSYTHGRAVALGILAASFISTKLGLLDQKVYLRIKGLMAKIGLPVRLRNVDLDVIYRAQQHDKKAIHGINRFVLPVKIGKVVVHEGIPNSLIKSAIKSLL